MFKKVAYKTSSASTSYLQAAEGSQLYHDLHNTPLSLTEQLMTELYCG